MLRSRVLPSILVAGRMLPPPSFLFVRRRFRLPSPRAAVGRGRGWGASFVAKTPHPVRFAHDPPHRYAGGRVSGGLAPHSNGDDYFSSSIGFDSTPMPSMSISQVSPGFIQSGGLRGWPTPDGVPVKQMSPGSSVMPCVT